MNLRQVQGNLDQLLILIVNELTDGFFLFQPGVIIHSPTTQLQARLFF